MQKNVIKKILLGNTEKRSKWELSEIDIRFFK